MFETDTQPDKFTLGLYFKTLTRLLGEPRKFFGELPPESALKRPVGFLLVSSLFFTGASLLVNTYVQPGLMSAILFVNAVGMALIASSLGYLAVLLTMGRCQTFTRFFSIYAFASGVTLLASWIPYFVWLTEPWKWWLIAVGLVHGCKFSWKQSLMVTAVSFSLVVFIFWLLIPNAR
ncbi:MAG: YIP1 family protein [Desulfobacterales bacterium]|nr:YIP1 family protein [Desulfobacterales bacterium]